MKWRFCETTRYTYWVTHKRSKFSPANVQNGTCVDVLMLYYYYTAAGGAVSHPTSPPLSLLSSPVVPWRSWFLQCQGRRPDSPVHPGDWNRAAESRGYQGWIHRGKCAHVHTQKLPGYTPSIDWSWSIINNCSFTKKRPEDRTIIYLNKKEMCMDTKCATLSSYTYTIIINIIPHVQNLKSFPYSLDGCSSHLPLSLAAILRRGLFCNNKWMERKTGTFQQWRPKMGTFLCNKALSDCSKNANKKEKKKTNASLVFKWMNWFCLVCLFVF